MLRGAAALALGLAVVAGFPARAEIVSARYEGATDRYPHAVLGDALEWERLVAILSDGRQIALRWPDTIVFEDLAPRLADLDGDGAPEVIVVESHENLGARLSVYGLNDGALSLRAATPFIGTRFRWLAPLGAADLDGDGRLEIAYVDRPHLARILTVWRYLPGTEGSVTLEPVGTASGATNHRIGEDFISGGLRDCGDGPEMITAAPDWSEIQASRLLPSGRIETLRLGIPATPGGFARAMGCR